MRSAPIACSTWSTAPSRRAAPYGSAKQFEPLPGIKLELFAIPGKVPLWLEEGNVSTDDIGEGTVCVAVEAAGKRLVYAPGCAHVTEDLNARIANADVLFFDGTLFADDEMIANGLGDKTGRRMGHMPRVGTRRNAGVACAPRACAAHPHPHQQFEPDPHRGIAGRGEGEGGRLGDRVRRNGDFPMNVHTPSEPMTPDALEAALRAIGPVRYHDLHPFHGLLHDGKLNKGQVQAWALNRFVYQSAIPRKDASLIARCEDRELRREWVHRITDHDGVGEDKGGIERWLILTDGTGARPRLCDLAGRRAAGDQVRGRGLCAFRARAAAGRGGGVQPDRTLRALDP